MPHTKISEETIKNEFYKSTVKFHVIATWVGLIFNVLWFINDYYILKEHVVDFLIFRSLVSFISALVVIFRKKLGIDIYFCMFFLVLGISVQNAYMWSVMDVEHFQKHTFAYIVLFIGAGMLVLWEIKYSFILAASTIIANIIFYKINSPLNVEEFFISGGLITLSVVVFSVFLIRTRYRLTYNEIKIRLELEQSKKVIEKSNIELISQKIEIETQKNKLEDINTEITDSIKYAKNIQQALLPSQTKFNTTFKNSFVFFKPKDIVSGDFFWVKEKRNCIFYVTADCTGHGVPGGFMTMLGLSFLEEIISRQNVMEPDMILNIMRNKIIDALNQAESTTENKDGMDITVCKIDKTNQTLTFSSANNNLYFVKNGSQKNNKTLEVYKGDRQPCGQHIINKPFSSHTIPLNEGDCIYTITDGYADQFGGVDGKKFRYKQLETILLENSHLDFEAQYAILDLTLRNWQGSNGQVDDILIIGVKV
jgi:phosphoserine phosphatase RsbU/P